MKIWPSTLPNLQRVHQADDRDHDDVIVAMIGATHSVARDGTDAAEDDHRGEVKIRPAIVSCAAEEATGSLEGCLAASPKASAYPR